MPPLYQPAGGSPSTRPPRGGHPLTGSEIIPNLIKMRVAGPLIGAAIVFAAVASGASAGHDRRAADFAVASSSGGFDLVSAAIGASAGTGLLIALLAIADVGRRNRHRRIIRRRPPTLRGERQRYGRKERKE